jgi:hypothetical protein
MEIAEFIHRDHWHNFSSPQSMKQVSDVEDKPFMSSSNSVQKSAGYDLAEGLERLTDNVKVATVLQVRSQRPPTQWNRRGGR